MRALGELLYNYKEIEEAEKMGYEIPVNIYKYSELHFRIVDVLRVVKIRNAEIIGIHFIDGDSWNIKFEEIIWDKLVAHLTPENTVEVEIQPELDGTE